MKIRIDGGIVVGWSGSTHELVPQSSVLIDGHTIASVGTDKSQTADKIIDAAGKMVSPGFVICTFILSSTSATIFWLTSPRRITWPPTGLSLARR
jgi:cytosine/adenosine deaminase-related metal-dependent hydrolase